MRNAIGVYFCATKDQYAIEICSLEERHQQIEFLFSGHRINRVRNRFGWRTAHRSTPAITSSSDQEAALAALACWEMWASKLRKRRTADRTTRQVLSAVDTTYRLQCFLSSEGDIV